jgi:hypothetical protein
MTGRELAIAAHPFYVVKAFINSIPGAREVTAVKET